MRVGSPPLRRLSSPPVVEVEQIAEEELVLLVRVGSWLVGTSHVHFTHNIADIGYPQGGALVFGDVIYEIADRFIEAR